MKTLASGLIVNTEQYYKLLEWKDNDIHRFINYCIVMNYPYSINRMTKEQYNDLLKFAKID